MKNTRRHKHREPLRFFGRTLIHISAALFLLQIALATPLLDDIVESWLKVADGGAMEAPRYIVVLGGGGIPSDTGLMRTYYGAKHSLSFPNATVILALPADDGRIGKRKAMLGTRQYVRMSPVSLGIPPPPSATMYLGASMAPPSATFSQLSTMSSSKGVS